MKPTKHRKRRENDFGNDRIAPLVVRIAIPSMLAQFVSVLYSIVDRIFVGNIPEIGDLALAGVGVCGPIVTMVGAFSFLVGVGGAPIMGMRNGEGKPKEAAQVVANCFLMLCVVSVAVTALALALKRPMLLLFGASEVTYPYANTYFTIYICGTIFALLSTGMNQFIIAQGYARAGMVSVMLGAVLNIILDPVLIFGLDMGVTGAALATVISQCASMVFVLTFLFKRSRIRITFGGYSRKLMVQVMSLGVTPFLIIAVDSVMIIAMNALLKHYGGVQADTLITCNTIVQSFMLVITLPLGGISMSTQGILSHNYGARRSDRILQAERVIILLCAAYTGLFFLLARTAAAPAFVSLFTYDAALNAQACQIIRICTMGIILLGIQYAIIDCFVGLGKPKFALLLSAFRRLVYFVAVFLLPYLFGAYSLFYAEPLCDILGPAVSTAVFLLSIKKILKKRELEPV